MLVCIAYNVLNRTYIDVADGNDSYLRHLLKHEFNVLFFVPAAFKNIATSINTVPISAAQKFKIKLLDAISAC